MTTLTIEIDTEKDLTALKELIARLGLTYEVNEHEELQYTDDLKQTLDNRYQDYKDGKIKMISAEESREQVHQLFAFKNKAMAYVYKFHPSAHKEYISTINWYLERSVKAAANFVKAVDKGLIFMLNKQLYTGASYHHLKCSKNLSKKEKELKISLIPPLLFHCIKNSFLNRL